MRLTADVVRSAPTYINPLKEREISLRGLKIPSIENLGVTEDQYECIDFSDNEIIKLENFPLLPHLNTLLLNNNRIVKLTSGLSQFIPKLANLMLTNNKISKFEELKALTEFKHLSQLSLVHNPITKLNNYRLYVIHIIPQLKSLDFAKIKLAERRESVLKFGVPGKEKKDQDKKTTEMDSDYDGNKVQDDGQETGASILPVGPTSGPHIEAMTPEMRKKILEKIQNASSVEEIERLEKILKSGLPKDLIQ